MEWTDFALWTNLSLLENRNEMKGLRYAWLSPHQGVELLWLIMKYACNLSTVQLWIVWWVFLERIQKQGWMRQLSRRERVPKAAFIWGSVPSLIVTCYSVFINIPGSPALLWRVIEEWIWTRGEVDRGWMRGMRGNCCWDVKEQINKYIFWKRKKKCKYFPLCPFTAEVLTTLFCCALSTTMNCNLCKHKKILILSR